MKTQHQHLSEGRFQQLSLMEQLASVGSEVERTISWQNKGNEEYSRLAFNRALELMSLSLEQPLSEARYRELSRTQELLVDYFQGSNTFQTTSVQWQHYFAPFTYAAQLQRGR